MSFLGFNLKFQQPKFIEERPLSSLYLSVSLNATCREKIKEFSLILINEQFSCGFLINAESG